MKSRFKTVNVLAFRKLCENIHFAEQIPPRGPSRALKLGYILGSVSVLFEALPVNWLHVAEATHCPRAFTHVPQDRGLFACPLSPPARHRVLL